jgi:hypothetical protein
MASTPRSGERPLQVLLALVGLRREELEGEDRAALLEDAVDSHGG